MRNSLEIKKVSDKLEEITSYQIKELIREEELGTKSCFNESKDIIINIINLSKRLKEANLKSIPLSHIRSLDHEITTTLNTFKSIKNFDPQKHTNNTRSNYIKNIETNYKSLFDKSTHILCVGFSNSDKILDEDSNIINQKNELNNLIKIAKDVSTKFGVSNHSIVFKNESEFHETKSKLWFIITCGILLLIIISAIAFLWIGMKHEDNVVIAQFTITKIIILTTLFYGLSITNRNYKAHKHNSIMNKHRQNSLSSFEAFSNASSADNQTKNAVLIEATHAIFSNQQTGYLRNDGDSDSNNKIIEIIKSVATKGE